MSTYLRLLLALFWLTPLQRWCTGLGLGLCAIFGGLLLDPDWRLPDPMEWGLLVGLGLPALLGGTLWRAVSAPRMVALAPHGRLRMLLAVAAIAATIAIFLVGYAYLYYLHWPPRFRPDLAASRNMFVGVFAAATWWALGFFIASRSPLAMLVVLVAGIASAVALDKSGVEHVDDLWKQSWGVAFPATLWLVFGGWYLWARRIHPPGWLLPGGQSFFASVATVDAATAGIQRPAALQRLLLGGSTLVRILSQWLLVVGMLLVVLLLLGRSSEEALIAAHLAFIALIVCPVIVVAQSAAIVRRARVLWLPSGFSRPQLFAFTERLLLKLSAGMAVLFCGLLLALWFTQPWHPVVPLAQVLGVVLVPPLMLVSYAMLQVIGPAAWRWPALAMVLVLMQRAVWRPLTFTDPGLRDGMHGWIWLAAVVATGVALRMLARLRWWAGDLPRRTTSPSAAS
jgi:hypothetical protein